MTVPHLLPPNATPQERALSVAIGRFNPPAVIPALWNADTCPESVLPFLAWANKIEEWDATWPVWMKREAVKGARSQHRFNGTLAAVRQALTVAGHGDADVIERADCITHDGSALRDGLRRRGGPTAWATFRVVLNHPITADQESAIRRLLDEVKRNCVHLVAIDVSRVAIRHNGQALRNGTYSRGVIN